MFRRIGKRFQYRLNLMLGGGSAGHYVALALIALLVVLLGLNAYFVGLFSPAALQAEGIDDHMGGGLIDSLWWSVKHVLDPGAFAEDYGAPWPVLLISLLLSVVGLSLLGIFIGFVTSSVHRRLELVRKGTTEVMEAGHVLILGWSRKVASILNFLQAASPTARVVLLAPREIDDMEDDLRTGSRDAASRIVLRSGSTHSLEELRRVGLSRAASVICLAHEHEDRNGRETDIETIKTLMLLSGYDRWDDERPRMVAEITQKRNVDVATIAASRTIPLVSSSEIISKVIVQCARQPGISAVYSEIFSHGGNKTLMFRCPEAANKRFGDVSHWFPDAVPIGVAWGGQEGNRMMAALNPEPDYEIAGDESLVLAAKHANPAFAAGQEVPAFAFRGDARKHTPRLERLLILGWNENIDEILTEFDGHSSTDAVVTILANHEEQFAHEYLDAAVAKGFRNIRIDYRRGSAINRAALRSLDPSAYDCVITLADESHGEEDPDARTIMTLLLLTDLGRNDRLPHVVAEIYDGENEPLLAGTAARDVIVSPRMVSLQLAQISRDPVLGAIYREILSAGGMEVRLQPAGRYVQPGEQCTFREIVAASQRFSEVALGIRSAGDAAALHLNPNKESGWELSERDNIVVLAQQLYE